MSLSDLERSWVALMITAGGLQLFTVITLILGLWPGDCRTLKRSTLYLIAAIFTLLASKFTRSYKTSSKLNMSHFGSLI